MAAPFLPLESERLVLRRFDAADLDAFHAYRTDPEVGRYQGWSAPTFEEARAFVAKQSQIEPGSLGVGAQIAVERKGSGETIGDLFLDTPADEPELARIGFTLAREHQGHGYATEAVETLLAAVFGTLGKRRVTALTYAANARSVALLERVGMHRAEHRVGSSLFEGKPVDDYVYAIARD